MPGAPAFFSMGGPSIGWQWGGQQTDFVLLVMNKDGMENLLEDRFSIGGNASAAAGPVGRTTEAATDAQLQAQILSWSRSQGLFAGVSLEGAVVQPSEKANARLYDRNVTVRAILKGEVSPVPEAAKEFVDRADEMLAFLIPHFEAEGKSYLSVGIGCTGGHHRSVAIAEELRDRLAQHGITATVRHRDIER